MVISPIAPSLLYWTQRHQKLSESKVQPGVDSSLAKQKRWQEKCIAIQHLICSLESQKHIKCKWWLENQLEVLGKQRQQTIKMVKLVTKNCAIATLVFGVLHVVIGITLFACCFVFSATITGGSVVAPYWTALPVSFILGCWHPLTNSCFLQKTCGGFVEVCDSD